MAGRDRRHDATEFLQIHAIPFEQAYRWVLSHTIVDAKSIIGILWAKQRLDLPFSHDRRQPAGRRR